MKPLIDSTSFGIITINNKSYDHDVVIKSSGDVLKRKKKLSKKIYGTSHKVSKEEIEFVLEAKTSAIIIGSGQYGVLEISDEAKKVLNKLDVDIHIDKTPQACNFWNSFKGKAVGLFHITC
ncbi:Mth938-like domain-containing protein [Bacteroidota bacterium]